MKNNIEKDVSTFYVEIKDTKSLRRSFLESSRETLQCLKRLDAYAQLRKEKAQHIKKLRTISNSINKSVEELQNKLPNIKMREETKPFDEAVHLHKKRKKAPQAPAIKNVTINTRKKIATELEILEDELNSIESKLDTLSK
ncbi:hypothetical protein K9M79_03870 [Candidatus Woesearchaeota archaeon]|nr:hypothetical protein [Candidatus Woesearchaeota archaeon]